MPIFREPGVAAAFNPFDFYLGPSATDPIQDLNGDPLVEGQFYWNTADNTVYFYTGSAWVSQQVVGGDLTSDLRLPDGSVGTPALGFTNDSDCGLYRIGTNNLGLSISGSKIIDIDSAGVDVTGALTTTGAVLVGNGAVGTPSLSFSGDSNTGLYSISGDTLGLTTGGTVRYSTSTSRAWSSLPLYVGTDSANGSITDVTRLNGGIFATANGATASIATGVATTAFTVPSMAGTYATYIVSASLAGANDVGNYHSVSLITWNGVSSIATNALKSGTLLTITLSGMNVQVTQSSGISNIVSWTATRIA